MNVWTKKDTVFPLHRFFKSFFKTVSCKSNNGEQRSAMLNRSTSLERVFIMMQVLCYFHLQL